MIAVRGTICGSTASTSHDKALRNLQCTHSQDGSQRLIKMGTSPWFSA